jgi:hypothetical protein
MCIAFWCGWRIGWRTEALSFQRSALSRISRDRETKLSQKSGQLSAFSHTACDDYLLQTIVTAARCRLSRDCFPGPLFSARNR